MKKFLIVIVTLVVLLVIMGGSLVSFMGPSILVDILHFGKQTLSNIELDKLLYPVAPKGYKYPAPPAEAAERSINCQDIYQMTEFPRTNPLCLNVFQTSPEEIAQKLSGADYDRIVLYAQNSVYDAPTSSDVTRNYIKDLYRTAKFMDQIAIPKFLAIYGLTDVSYIKFTKPYPYLYYRISSLDEADKICHDKDASGKIQGCARSYYASIIPIFAVGPQMSSALPLARSADKARFIYLTHFPSDCYANLTFLHETAHLFNAAAEAFTGAYVMDSWFNEQVAGYFSIYGAELACGPGTVVMQKEPGVKNVPQGLAKFNCVFPPVDLSHDYPKDDLCRQALLTEWYRYLSEGDLRVNFTRFFVEQRATTPSLVSDTVFANFLLGLDPNPASRELLLAKGCAL